MKRALLAALALGALAVPFLGMSLARDPSGVDVFSWRPWLPVRVAAAVLAGFVLVRFVRLPRFLSGIPDLLTSRPAAAAWILLAVVFPLLPREGLKWVAERPGLAWLTLNTLTDLWLYAILALGLNLIVGQTGVLVLGYGGFYGIGAYATALLASGLPYWGAVALGVPVGALAAAAVGIFVGFPALRLRGDYLAIVTLGFGEAMVLVLKNWSSVTGGVNGLSLKVPPALKGTWADPRDGAWHYALALGAALLALLFHSRLNRSRIGRALAAVREDETAARAMGIDASRMKLLAFALAAGWAGVAGALFAARIRFVTPESFTFLESVIVLSMVVLGGMGNLRGVVLGAAAVTLLQEVLRGAGAYRMLVFGALLVAMMVFRPEGLLPGRRR